MRKEIAIFRCGIVRSCARRDCVFNMIANMGYSDNPRDNDKNLSIEKVVGKGFYPTFKTVGKYDHAEVFCDNFIDKDRN